MNPVWYYADRQQQVHGPVAAGQLQALAAQGELVAGSLVWREGFHDWVPLARLALDLDLEVADDYAPAAAMPAATPRGRRALTVLLVLALAGLVGVGGLAAIALPAYHDYRVRSQVVIALEGLHAVRQRVVDVRREDGRCPANGEVGFLAEEAYANDFRTRLFVGSADDGRCAIEIELAPGIGVGAGTTPRIALFLDAAEHWQVQTNLAPRHLPAALRDELGE